MKRLIFFNGGFCGFLLLLNRVAGVVGLWWYLLFRPYVYLIHTSRELMKEVLMHSIKTFKILDARFSRFSIRALGFKSNAN